MQKINLNYTNIIKAIQYVGVVRYGKVTHLITKIGDEYFKYLLSSNIIYQGKNHPDIWRITDKGRRRSRALSSKITRFIARFLWNLRILI